MSWDLELHPEETKTVKHERWDPGQLQVWQNLLNLVQSRTGQPAPTSPNMYVPTTGQEQRYFGMVDQLAQSRAASGQPLYDVGPEWARNYYEKAIKPAYMEEWKDVTLPAIERAYAGPGFYSSARQEATTEAGEDLGRVLAGKRAELEYGEELARREAIDRAFQQQQQVIGTQQQAGQYERGIKQEEVMSDLQKFLMGERVQTGTDRQGRPQYSENPLNNPAIAMALQLLGLDRYVWGQESTGASLPYYAYPAWNQGFGQGLGSAIGSKSDRRLKSNIEYM